MSFMYCKLCTKEGRLYCTTADNMHAQDNYKRSVIQLIISNELGLLTSTLGMGFPWVVYS